jgi:ABC-type transport system involved in multi-copper enzyme maturation permease subunit
MLRSLAWKESREVFPLVAVALVVQLYLFGWAMGLPLVPFIYSRGAIPFVQDMPGVMLLIVGGLAAIVLGLRQTTREASGGTFPFLLHRPVSRNAIFATKLLVGIAAYLIVAGVPLACYTLWAATPGTHASPFFWWLAAARWGVLVQLPLLYLGAFLSGLRPARWLGSRLLPLFGAGLVWVAAQGIRAWSGLYVLEALAMAALAACLVLAILHVAATRDYS